MLLSFAIVKYIAYLEVKECSNETIRGYKILLNEFLTVVEKQRMEEVFCSSLTASDIELYLAYRKRKGDKSSSRNRHYYILRSFFNYLVQREYIVKNPVLVIEPVRIQNKERRYLSLDQIQALIDAIEHETIRAAVATLAYTGLRVSEMCNLRNEDVDLGRAILYVVNGKGKKDRVVPISDRLLQILKAYKKRKNKRKSSEFFFTTNRYTSISPEYVNRDIKKAAKSLRFDFEPTAHTLRHSFASALIAKDASLPSVQKLLGHADLRITSRYIHQDISALQEAVELL